MRAHAFSRKFVKKKIEWKKLKTRGVIREGMSPIPTHLKNVRRFDVFFYLLATTVVVVRSGSTASGGRNKTEKYSPEEKKKKRKKTIRKNNGNFDVVSDKKTRKYEMIGRNLYRCTVAY